MLERKTIENPKAIETFFCEPFGKLPLRKATEDEMELLMRIAISKEPNRSLFSTKEEFNEMPFSVQLAYKALNGRFSFKMSDSLVILVAVVGKSAGIIVMYLTYLQYRAKKMGKEELDIGDFVMIFPDGFPTDDSLQDIWDSQKVDRGERGGSDNLLDYQFATQSIQFLKEA